MSFLLSLLMDSPSVHIVMAVSYVRAVCMRERGCGEERNQKSGKNKEETKNRTKEKGRKQISGKNRRKMRVVREGIMTVVTVTTYLLTLCLTPL